MSACGCGGGGGDGRPCDCCVGVGSVPPSPAWNRAGLPALSYRLGTHASFLDTMLARLSSADLPALAALKTRQRDDASIALLDAWATVADVLSFYQERIANEGYLRTATERRSVLELARLVGYTVRPGVAATTYLAYTLETESAPVSIEPGSRASSVPGPGEQLQTFETADPLEARVEWNRLVPRLTEPQTAASIRTQGLYLTGTALSLKAGDPLLVDFADGKGPALHRIETVEIDFEKKHTRVVLRRPLAVKAPGAALRRIVTRFSDLDAFDVSPDTATTKRVLSVLAGATAVADRDAGALGHHLDAKALPALQAELEVARERHFTKLEPWIDGLLGELRGLAEGVAEGAPRTAAQVGTSDVEVLGQAVARLKRAPSLPPPSARQLDRDVAHAFGTKADTLPRILAALQPALKTTLYSVYRNLPTQASRITVWAFRVSAAPFGHNAPPRLTDVAGGVPHFGEWRIDQPLDGTSHGPGAMAVVSPPHHTPTELFLDNEYPIAPDSLLVIERPDTAPLVIAPAGVQSRSMVGYGLSGKSMRLTLPEKQPWLDDRDGFETVRGTRVLAGSEPLELAEVPITTAIGGGEVELDRLYEDLEPGRWLILTGERSDLIGPDQQPVRGVKAGELLMLAAVAQRRRRTPAGVDLAEDANHTFITFARELAYEYVPGSVEIFGNVVRATHGETVHEVLGSGDAASPLQRFTLKRPPLTWVSAPTVSGVASTLEVRVNGVAWHEVASIGPLTPADRAFVTSTDEQGRTSAIFGNGERGSRVPTGVENVVATYRTGIGQGGNVGAKQISLLTSRPPGVKDVVNPLRASGGADAEDRDDARANVPLAVRSLDRLVSTRDYADFARTFAGIAKAAAVRLSDGRRQVVHVTVAGAADAPIEPTSDLFRNLLLSLRQFGEAHAPVTLALRDRLALVISANVRVAPDYAWELVEPRIRAALLRDYGFARIRLGRDLVLAGAIAAIQGIAGVDYVDVDVFDTVTETQLLAQFGTSSAATLVRRERLAVAEARLERGIVRPAQIAYLTPEVPDTLILKEITS